MTAARSPSWQDSVEPVSRSSSAAPGIAAEDWDLLFRAALEFLATLAIGKAAPEKQGAPLRAQAAAIHECLDALDHLRRGVPAHSTEPMYRPVQTEGEITSNRDIPASEWIVEA